MLLRNVFPLAENKQLKKALYPQKFLRKVVISAERSRYLVGSLLYYLSMNANKHMMTPIDIYTFGVKMARSIQETRSNYHQLQETDIGNAALMFTFLEVLDRAENFPHRVRLAADSASIAFDDTKRFLEILDSVSYTMRSFVTSTQEAGLHDVLDLKEGKEKKPRTTEHKYRVMLTGDIRPENTDRVLAFFTQYRGTQMDVPTAFLHKIKACTEGKRYVWLRGKSVFISDLRMLDMLALAGIPFTKVVELT